MKRPHPDSFPVVRSECDNQCGGTVVGRGGGLCEECQEFTDHSRRRRRR